MITLLLLIIAVTLLFGPEFVFNVFRLLVKTCFALVIVVALAVVSVKGFT